MAGYHGFSKSNNAILAEENGEFPATIAAKKLGMSAAAIKFYLQKLSALSEIMNIAGQAHREFAGIVAICNFLEKSEK